MPDDLRTSTHVFIRRGGVQPSLSAPYQGPYRVVSKLDTHFRVDIPGRGTESVALARLKPAHMPESEDNDEDQPCTPPSPNPPGRRPGWRTRPPAPTDRVTRQTAVQPELEEESEPNDSDRSNAQPTRDWSDDVDADEAEPEEEPAPPVPTPPPPPRPPRLFTKPAERKFSNKGSRTNYAAALMTILNNEGIIKEHSKAQDSERQLPVEDRQSSGGDVVDAPQSPIYSL